MVHSGNFTTVWWVNGEYWPIFIGRYDTIELNEIMGTFAHVIDPYGRGVLLL